MVEELLQCGRERIGVYFPILVVRLHRFEDGAVACLREMGLQVLLLEVFDSESLEECSVCEDLRHDGSAGFGVFGELDFDDGGASGWLDGKDVRVSGSQLDFGAQDGELGGAGEG